MHAQGNVAMIQMLRMEKNMIVVLVYPLYTTPVMCPIDPWGPPNTPALPLHLPSFLHRRRGRTARPAAFTIRPSLLGRHAQHFGQPVKLDRRAFRQVPGRSASAPANKWVSTYTETTTCFLSGVVRSNVPGVGRLGSGG